MSDWAVVAAAGVGVAPSVLSTWSLHRASLRRDHQSKVVDLVIILVSSAERVYHEAIVRSEKRKQHRGQVADDKSTDSMIDLLSIVNANRAAITFLTQDEELQKTTWALSNTCQELLVQSTDAAWDSSKTGADIGEKIGEVLVATWRRFPPDTQTQRQFRRSN